MMWVKMLFHIILLAPLSVFLYLGLSGALSPDPGKQMILYLGHTAICTLIFNFSLPLWAKLRAFTHAKRLSRLTGLYAFLYALLHFIAYLAFVTAFDRQIFLEDIVDRPYAFFGMLAFLILCLMALTSTKGWQKRLKRKWKLLHRWVYLALLLIIIHILWVARSDLVWAYSYGLAVLLLLGWRFFDHFGRSLISK